MKLERTPEQNQQRQDRGAIEAELVAAGTRMQGKACRCPWHDDAHASAGIYQSEDGAWKFKCLACAIHGDVYDIRARRTNSKPGDFLAEHRDAAPVQRNVDREPPPRWFADLDAIKAANSGFEDAYQYTNPTTKAVELLVVRIKRAEGGKRFTQMRPAPGGGWEEKAPPAPRPIYNRTRVASAPDVVVVEGEKCVHALAKLGIVATTTPAGAGNSKYADLSPLAGKTCILWPDNDPIIAPGKPNAGKRLGIEHMRDIAATLQTLTPPARVLWVEPEDLALPDKGDVVDYIAEYGGATVAEQRRAVETVLQLASPIGPASDLETMIEDSISGRRRLIPFPWPVLTRLTRALMPGMVTVIAGDPGCSKSFFVLESGAYWHENGAKVAIYMLEDERAYHLNRALAQRDHNSHLIDSEWMRDNPAETRAAFTRHREFLGGFGNCITTTPDNEDVNLSGILKWVEKQANAGADIIVVDPITAAAYSSDRSWQEDRDFIIRAKSIVKQHGARLILTTHPSKSKGGGALHSLAGGAAYPRFAHNVLWITAPEKPRKVYVASPQCDFKSEVNRTIRLGKTRNGPGSGMELAYQFEGKSLRFSEQGAIKREDDAHTPELDNRPRVRAPQALQDPFADETP